MGLGWGGWREASAILDERAGRPVVRCEIIDESA